MLVGCTTVGGWNDVERGAPQGYGGAIGGPQYYLPKAVLKVSVNFTPDSGFSISVGAPTYVGDAAAGLRQLRYQPSPFAADDVSLLVDASTGLLGIQTVKTDDRLTEIGTNLGKLLGVTESAVGPTTVVELFVEPRFEGTGDGGSFRVVTLEGEDASAAITRRLHAWARFAANNQPPATDEAGKARLARMNYWLTSAQTAQLTLRYTAEPSALVPAAEARRVDCGPGLCARRLHPGLLVIAMSVGDHTPLILGEAALNLPNGVRPQVIRMERAAFADVDTTVTLQNGVLTGLAVKRGSMAEGALLFLPNLVGEAVKGATGILVDREKLVRAELALIKAEEELRAKQTESHASAKVIDAPLPGLSDLRGGGSIPGSTGGVLGDGVQTTPGSTGNGEVVDEEPTE